MTRLTNVKRIIAEDFPQENQQLISKLGYVLNEFMSDVVEVVNGNIDFDNLTQDLLQFEITVDATGKPLKNASVNVGRVNPLGFQVINARTNIASNSPTAQPFITFSPTGNNIITITNITGLRPNVTYFLTVVVY